MHKIKAIDPKIVVNSNVNKPCYSIEYFCIEDGQWHIGCSSYDLKQVAEWLNTAFDVVKSDVVPVVRCKDCKNNEYTLCGWCKEFERPITLDDYCSYGEKKN